MASLSTRNASAAAALSLHYGDTLAVRLRLPATPTPPLREIAEEYFDSESLLKPEQFRQFEKVMEQLRRVDDTAVVYSDVLEFIDRENGLVEGLEFERKMLARLKRGRDPLKRAAQGPAVSLPGPRGAVCGLPRPGGAGR